MTKDTNFRSELIKFSRNFDTTYEDKAVSVRGHFIQSYPLGKIKNITLDEYVIGRGTESFCACVEAKSRAWANMQGATAYKFGIYFGKTKSDPEVRYRFTKKFGVNSKEAFDNVKSSLLNLVKAGKAKKFKEIDGNPLSQMFKAKILSLYYPDIYLNVCSSEHIERIALEMGISEKQYISEYQHLLVESKLASKITKHWSNPKFMSFLYAKYIRRNLDDTPSNTFKKPRKKSRRKVNFEDVSKARDAIGKASEEFAVDWEINRLIGLGYKDLANKIDDRRDIPSYGYDYLSYSSPGHERFIEVKSVGWDRKDACFRFYLSENELEVSKSVECIKDYYFYLVFFDKNGKPERLLSKRAEEFYHNSEIIPCAYVVRFDEEDHK